MLTFGKLSVKNKLMAVMLLTNALVLLAVGVALVVNETYSQRKAAQAQLMTLANIISANAASALVFNDLKAAAQNLAVLRAKPDVPYASIDEINKIIKEKRYQVKGKNVPYSWKNIAVICSGLIQQDTFLREY